MRKTFKRSNLSSVSRMALGATVISFVKVMDWDWQKRERFPSTAFRERIYLIMPYKSIHELLQKKQ